MGRGVQITATSRLSGEFSIKFAYRVNQRDHISTTTNVPRSFWKRMWLSELHGQHKTLLWRLILNIIPTKERLSQLFPVADPNCVLCNMVPETGHHLILDCPFTIVVWRNSKWQVNLEAFHHLTFQEWFKLLLDPRNCFPMPEDDKKEMLQFAVITLEHIWMHRNKVLHGHSPPNIIELGQTISRCTQIYHKAAGQWRTVRRTRHDPPIWTPPTWFHEGKL